MFATKLDLFSIENIIVPTHAESNFKTICILNLSIVELVPKQPIESICVLVVNLTIPPNTSKQHLLKTFFHLEIGR
jgi:hypothetical protein